MITHTILDLLGYMSLTVILGVTFGRMLYGFTQLIEYIGLKLHQRRYAKKFNAKLK